MKEFTKAEEQVMQVLWKLPQGGFVRDILEHLPTPKPAYNTVSTIVRILEKKKFVGHRAYGKTHQYYPLISKSEYSSFSLKKLLGGYFGGSFKELVSFFAKEHDMDIAELEELIKHAAGDLEDKDDE
ncbi:MAG: transcriptional regulator [Cyclobacteriaceae bacterium]|nr:MAG: transcriptional regulator [Cyclobacteriaceae bacterium]